MAKQFLVTTPDFRAAGPFFTTDTPNQFGIGLFILFGEWRGRGWVDSQQKLVSDFLFKEGVSFSTITPHYENGMLTIDCASQGEADRGLDLIRNYLYEEQYALYNRELHRGGGGVLRTQREPPFVSAIEQALRTPTGGKRK